MRCFLIVFCFKKLLLASNPCVNVSIWKKSKFDTFQQSITNTTYVFGNFLKRDMFSKTLRPSTTTNNSPFGFQEHTITCHLPSSISIGFPKNWKFTTKFFVVFPRVIESLFTFANSLWKKRYFVNTLKYQY